MKRPTGKLSLDDVFNESVELLLAGKPVDAYLQTQPEYAVEITSLLETTGFVLKQRAVPLRAPAVAAASRQRFMAAARDLAAARKAPGLRELLGAWWASFLAGFAGPRRVSYALALVLAVVMLFGVSTTGVVTASASALPGDRLYPVKLIAEQAQLMLARDSAARQTIEQAIDARRVQEAQTISALRRPVENLRLSGAIEAFAETEWLVAGLKLVITPRTLIVGQPAVGAVAFAELTAPGDGRLIAVALRVGPAPTRALGTEPVETPTPTAEPPPPTETPTALQPTATAMREPAIVASDTPTPSDTPAPTATPTKTATPTRTPTRTPTAGPSPSPLPTVGTGISEGVLVAREGNVWIIRDADTTQRVVVDASTALIGDPQIGDQIHATWRQLKDGVKLATLIKITRKASPTLEPLEFLGTIQKLEGEWWTVNGI
ncbi:MAG: hypothetical protein QG637_1020, partial [Chloroflexota bacterium]|nr:hypothetical protein [Chloroflexota bacterium]